MSVDTVLKLGRGAVIELERKVGEPVDVFLNNRLVARGEVVVVDDKLGITMTEIIKQQKISNGEGNYPIFVLFAVWIVPTGFSWYQRAV